MLFSKKTEIDDTSPSVEYRNFFPIDQRLRVHGYRIARRPKQGEPVWLDPTGKLVSQSTAIKRLPN